MSIQKIHHNYIPKSTMVLSNLLYLLMISFLTIQMSTIPKIEAINETVAIKQLIGSTTPVELEQSIEVLLPVLLIEVPGGDQINIHNQTDQFQDALHSKDHQLAVTHQINMATLHVVQSASL